MTDNVVPFSRPRLPDMTETDLHDLNLLAGALHATRRVIAVEWDRGDEGCQYLTVELPGERTFLVTRAANGDYGLLGPGGVVLKGGRRLSDLNLTADDFR